MKELGSHPLGLYCVCVCVHWYRPVLRFGGFPGNAVIAEGDSAIAQALAKEGGKPSWDFLWGQLPGLHRLFESRCDTGMACSLVIQLCATIHEPAAMGAPWGQSESVGVRHRLCRPCSV
jgi:hypothetical protein